MINTNTDLPDCTTCDGEDRSHLIVKSGELGDSSQINALTGLRGVLALWVVALHILACLTFLNYSLNPNNIFTNLFLAGDFAVDGFFLLSGFVISYSYSKKLEPVSRANLKKFLILRLARIYPVHLLILIIYAILKLGGITFAVEDCGNPVDGLVACERFGLVPLVEQILLISSWGWSPYPKWNLPAWSLSSEWFAYLIFPIINIFSLKIKRPIAALAGAFASITFLILILEQTNLITDTGRSTEFGLLRLFLEFTAGCLVFRYFCSESSIGINWEMLGYISAALFLMCGLVIPGYLRYYLFLPFFISLIQSKGIFSKILSTRIAVWFGKISFSLYLCHMLVLELLGVIFSTDVKSSPSVPSDLEALGLVSLSLILMIGLGAMLYYTIEEPFRKIIKRKFT